MKTRAMPNFNMYSPIVGIPSDPYVDPYIALYITCESDSSLYIYSTLQGTCIWITWDPNRVVTLNLIIILIAITKAGQNI